MVKSLTRESRKQTVGSRAWVTNGMLVKEEKPKRMKIQGCTSANVKAAGNAVLWGVWMLNVISLPSNGAAEDMLIHPANHLARRVRTNSWCWSFPTHAFILLTIFPLVNLEGGPFCLKFYCENSMRKCEFPQSMLSTQDPCGSSSHVLMTINTGWGNNSHHDLAGSPNS